MFYWTTLGSMLGSSTSRAIYVLPVAGYVILYSDYFQSLHKFSTLTHGGFLTFSERVSLFYYGSLVLLVAYGLWWLFSPPLLRGKRDLQHFVSDIVVARARSTVVEVARSAPFTPETIAIFVKRLNAGDKDVFDQTAQSMSTRAHLLGSNPESSSISYPPRSAFTSHGTMKLGLL
jgi:hypothetical protein